VEDSVDELDLTVKHIRSAIFGLESRVERNRDGVRTRVLGLVAESAPLLGFEPTVLFEGPVDTATPEPVATDMLATLREALSNVARHAGASHVDVVVNVDTTSLTLRVTDDGVGPPAPDRPRGHGLDNMKARATRREGAFDISPAAPRGTVVEWRVPLK
jgi:signal transduction histidine kinase